MGRKHASRKFTDLILTASSKWANWEPAVKIEPGDYGTINRDTGQFEFEGNVYRDSKFELVASEHLPETSPPIENIRIQSVEAMKFNAGSDVHTSFLGLVEPSLGGQWKFGRSRGALLLMYGCRITSVPNDLLAVLKRLDWAREKHIVTQVYTCRGYFLYLSDKSCSSNEKVSVDLRLDSPIATAPGVTPGAGVKDSWHADGLSGCYQSAVDSELSFFPLYQVKGLGKRAKWFRRGPYLYNDDSDEDQEESEDEQGESGQDDEDDTSWLPVEVPWNCLDDDGNELPDDFPGSDADSWDYAYP